MAAAAPWGRLRRQSPRRCGPRDDTSAAAPGGLRMSIADPRASGLRIHEDRQDSSGLAVVEKREEADRFEVCWGQFPLVHIVSSGGCRSSLACPACPSHGAKRPFRGSREPSGSARSSAWVPQQRRMVLSPHGARPSLASSCTACRHRNRQPRACDVMNRRGPPATHRRQTKRRRTPSTSLVT
jgi:hypothetical protein